MPVALLTLLAAIVGATVYFFSKTWLPALGASSGGAIDQQLTLNFILLGIVFCATQLALGLFIWKYRDRNDSRESTSAAQPDARVELAWMTLAAALFLGLNIAGAVFWPSVARPISANEIPVRVEVTGVQFRWYFRQPGADERFGTTRSRLVDASEGNPLGIDRADPAAADDVVSSELVIPAGREVEVTLRAQDVIHSFFVPALRLKQDAVPGQEIVIHIAPADPGTYDIACAQLCGMGHYQMNAKLRVIPEAEYRTWLARSAATVAKR
jgi:cytochrome c oxidase subunit II